MTQPAIVFLQVGLFHVLREYGINPHVIVGHSIGEIAASYASGSLSLREIVKVAFHRSTQQAQVPSGTIYL